MVPCLAWYPLMCCLAHSNASPDTTRVRVDYLNSHQPRLPPNVVSSPVQPQHFHVRRCIRDVTIVVMDVMCIGGFWIRPTLFFSDDGRRDLEDRKDVPYWYRVRT